MSDAKIRPLTGGDFEAVVALDARVGGQARRGYFERRLAAALRRPKGHLQLAAEGPKGLAGFLLARRAEGEFGGREPAVVLETIGVDPGAQRGGIGRRLLAELAELAARGGAKALRTQADWREHALLRLLDRTGFKLAPRQILERAVHRMPLPATDEEIETPPPLVRQLRAGDFDWVVRVDQRITGLNRAGYLQRKFEEALQESAIAVSQVVEDDGFVVAFGMARVDLGDFGRLQATASLDTIGVDPGFTGKGYARALLTQLIENLAALHVERLETEVGPEDGKLRRFLHAFGFRPAQRLAFEKT
ncbi:MAG TPA: GNAT family N-acetyltransferase [Myxococcales bacterium]|nr:GNAT family N-acetyltransferase [Myxococcales bacterium]